METRDKCETGVGVVLHTRLKNKSPLTNSALRSCQVTRAITSAGSIDIDLIMLLIAVKDSSYAMAAGGMRSPPSPGRSQLGCVQNAAGCNYKSQESF